MELNEEIDAVEFIAVRGQGFTSDIALDNVFLDTKSCPSKYQKKTKYTEQKLHPF